MMNSSTASTSNSYQSTAAAAADSYDGDGWGTHLEDQRQQRLQQRLHQHQEQQRKMRSRRVAQKSSATNTNSRSDRSSGDESTLTSAREFSKPRAAAPKTKDKSSKKLHRRRGDRSSSSASRRRLRRYQQQQQAQDANRNINTDYQDPSGRTKRSKSVRFFPEGAPQESSQSRRRLQSTPGKGLHNVRKLEMTNPVNTSLIEEYLSTPSSRGYKQQSASQRGYQQSAPSSRGYGRTASSTRGYGRAPSTPGYPFDPDETNVSLTNSSSPSEVFRRPSGKTSKYGQQQRGAAAPQASFRRPASQSSRRAPTPSQASKRAPTQESSRRPATPTSTSSSRRTPTHESSSRRALTPAPARRPATPAAPTRRASEASTPGRAPAEKPQFDKPFDGVRAVCSDRCLFIAVPDELIKKGYFVQVVSKDLLFPSSEVHTGPVTARIGGKDAEFRAIVKRNKGFAAARPDIYLPDSQHTFEVFEEPESADGTAFTNGGQFPGSSRGAKASLSNLAGSTQPSAPVPGGRPGISSLWQAAHPGWEKGKWDVGKIGRSRTMSQTDLVQSPAAKSPKRRHTTSGNTPIRPRVI